MFKTYTLKGSISKSVVFSVTIVLFFPLTVLHQVILAMVSAAFLMVAAMTVFLCGFCNLFKKSSDLEQKQPILGMDENGQGFKKQGTMSGSYNSNARKSSPVINTG